VRGTLREDVCAWDLERGGDKEQVQFNTLWLPSPAPPPHPWVVQVFDASGNNVALASAGTRCWSRAIGWNGNPACLNDSSTDPNCFSHSQTADGNNFNICVLPVPVNVSRVVVYPRPSWAYRSRSLNVALYAGVSGWVEGNGGAPRALGANLATYNITTSYAPSVVTLPPLATSIPCPSTAALLPNITYQTEYTSVGLACRVGGTSPHRLVCFLQSVSPQHPSLLASPPPCRRGC
jgi:hypothetical protein